MTGIAKSKSGVVIRITDERWSHICEEQAELAGLRLDVLKVIAEPERIIAGNVGESLALKKNNPMAKHWWSCS